MSIPILRWAGGKSHAIPTLGPIILDHLEHSGGVYREPFFGGGSVGLHVGARYPKQIVVSDVVEPLINFYRQLKDNRVELAKTVAQIGIEYGLDEKAYYAVRDERPDDPLFRAAQFLFLNALGFNGLYRENASGVYNVPSGSRAKNGTAKLPERKAFDLASQALQRADIRCGDFEAVIDEAESGCLVYVDSPYYYAKDGFTDYSKGGFGVPEQERLAFALYRAHERGAVFIAHNSLSPEDGVEYNSAGEVDRGVRYWYEWATIVEVDEPRRVSANGDRAAAPCCVITNDSTLAEKMKNRG